MKRKNKIFLWIVLVLLATTILILNLCRVVDFSQELYSGDIQKAKEESTLDTGWEVTVSPTSNENWTQSQTVTISGFSSTSGFKTLFYAWTNSKEQPEDTDYTTMTDDTGIYQDINGYAYSFDITKDTGMGEFYLHLKFTDGESTVSSAEYRGYTGKYCIDNTAPQLDLSTAEGWPNEWVNLDVVSSGDPYIKLIATDGSGYIGRLYTWQEPNTKNEFEGESNKVEELNDLKGTWETDLNDHGYTESPATAKPGYDDEQNIKVYYQVYDRAGNVSETLTTYIKIDNTAPVADLTMQLGDSSGEAYTDDTWTNQSIYIALNCVDEPSANVLLPDTDDGREKCSGLKSATYTVTKDGSVYNSLENQTDATTLTEEGTYTITITATDNAGNTGTSTKTVKIDKTAPTGMLIETPTATNKSTITVGANNLSDGEGSGVSHYRLMAWYGDTETSTYYDVNSEDVEEMATEISHELTFSEIMCGETGNSNNGDGIYRYVLAIYDKVGNVNILTGELTDTSMGSKKITLDTTVPEIVLGTNENTEWSNSHSVIVTVVDALSGLAANQKIKHGWSTSETIAPTDYTEVELSNSEGTNSTTFAAEGERLTGKYYLWVVPNTTVKDLAGNEQTEAVVSTGTFNFVSGELTAATMAFTTEDGEYTPGEDNWTNQTVSITLNNDASEGTTTTYTIDGVESAATSIAEEGRHEIEVTTTDTAGNTATRTYKVNIDKTAPTPETMTFTNDAGEIFEPGLNNWTNEKLNIELNGDATDEMSGVSGIIYIVNGVPGVTSITEEGTYSVETTTIDEAGNIEKQTYTVNIDKTAPTITLGTNENTTSSETHSVTVTLSDAPSGLEANQKVKYGWSTSATIVPTDYTEVDLSNSEGINSTSFAAEGNNLNGQYYLWVVPNTTVKDLAGNEQTEAVVSTGCFYFVSEELIAATITFTGGAGEYEPREDIWINEYLDIKLNNDASEGSTSTYSVEKNGEIICSNQTEQMKLEDGSYTITVTTIGIDGKTATREYKVKIDSIAPVMTITPTSGDWAKSHTVKVTIKDDHSGLTMDFKRIFYGWVTDPTSEPENKIILEQEHEVGTTDTIEFTLETPEDIESGEYYLWFHWLGDIMDQAWNYVEGNDYEPKTYGLFKIDVTNPTAGTMEFTNEDGTTYTPGEDSWTNQDVTLNLTNGTDLNSGHASTTYTIDGVESTATSITAEGKHTIVITTTDNVGNSSTRTYNVNIDKTGPTIENVTLSPTETTTGSVTLTITANDDNGIGLANEAYSFDNGETWQKENTKTYTQNTSGIKVKVKDALGNVSTYENVIDITNITKGKLEVDSEDYNIAGTYISNIFADTTIENFLDNIETNAQEIKITNKNNQEVTSGKIATGMTITFKYEEETVSYKLVVKGDTDGDGKITVIDILEANTQRLLPGYLKDEFLMAGDIDKDGRITILGDIFEINALRLKNRQ